MSPGKKVGRRTPRSATRSSDDVVAAKQELVRQARFDAISSVDAVLGHEVSNVIGALTTCVQVLRRNPELSRHDMELLDILQISSRRLEEIASALSAFGRSKALHLEPVDLHALINETLGRLRRDERCSSSIAIHRDFDPPARDVEVDREQFGSAMWNLCLNAVQAMGERGDLLVGTRKSGTSVRITVQDSGPGISPAGIAHLFEPLYSTKPRGMGLGLAITRCIVERHGGEIFLEKERPGGACFTVSLPVRNSRRGHA